MMGLKLFYNQNAVPKCLIILWLFMNCALIVSTEPQLSDSLNERVPYTRKVGSPEVVVIIICMTYITERSPL